MQEYYINLPFPPTVNSYYSKTQRGVYISKRGRLFREQVSAECNEQNMYGVKLEQRLTVDIILYPPDARTRDLDNYMKALFDSLTIAGIWVDDEQIDSFTPHRGVKVAGGASMIRIREHHGFILPYSPDVWEHIE